MTPRRSTLAPAPAGGAGRPLPLSPDEAQPPYPGSLWAKITGQAAGTNRYAFEQINEGDTAAFDVGLSAGFAAAGTSAADGAPAYEVNGRQDVPAGTRVRLWPAGDLSYYTFVFGEKPAAATDCAGCGWLAGLALTSCLQVSVNGAAQPLYLTTADRLTWTSPDLLNICGTDYTLTVRRNAGGVPRLTLTQVGGSGLSGSGSGGGAATEGQWNCCGCAFSKWTLPLADLCPDEPDTGDPCTNVVEVRVDAADCAPGTACGTAPLIVVGQTVVAPLVISGVDGFAYAYYRIALAAGASYCFRWSTDGSLLSEATATYSTGADCAGAPQGPNNIGAVAPAGVHAFSVPSLDPYEGLCTCLVLRVGAGSPFDAGRPVRLEFGVTAGACPPAPSYDCVSGACVDPGDGSGAYPSYAACAAACGGGGGGANSCCPGVSLPTTFHATCSDGRTVTLTWDGSEWSGASSPDRNVIEMYCDAATWKLLDGSTFETVAGSGLSCGPPFACTFTFAGFTWTVTP